MLDDTVRNDRGPEPFRVDFPERMRTLALAPALDVHVADSCNLRCRGCVHFVPLAQERFLDLDDYEADLRALSAIPGIESYFRGLFLMGGEPLLRENRATVRAICEHAREMGLPLSAITNGYDLDAYIDLLEKFEFRKLQVTVDGVGQVNDRRRLHRDGLPTYGRIEVYRFLRHGELRSEGELSKYNQVPILRRTAAIGKRPVGLW